MSQPPARLGGAPRRAGGWVDVQNDFLAPKIRQRKTDSVFLNESELGGVGVVNKFGRGHGGVL